MPVINRNDLINFETEKRKNTPTNWLSVADKFLGNDKVQKSIFSIIEKFKAPKENQIPKQIPNPVNIPEIEKNAIKAFLKKMVSIGRRG